MSPIASSSSTAPKSIVIVGGGIIGVCTAYYTSISPRFQPAKGDTITLVEATDVASAASGKAGGLLALDWHGQATASESASAWWQRNRRMRRRIEADESHPNRCFSVPRTLLTQVYLPFLTSCTLIYLLNMEVKNGVTGRSTRS